MDLDLKKQIDEKQGLEGFIKVTDKPVHGLSDQQRVALNRKANTLFNEGKIDMAERIFRTTGYSDGLTRCGDVHFQKNDFLGALKLYLLAHNQRKSGPLIEKLSSLISTLLNDN